MRLIINADDFGLSKSITDGIVYGIKNGLITSTTIMANMPFAKYAVKEALKNNIKCVGLHVTLTVGKPIVANKNLTDENGFFLYGKKQISRKDLDYSDVYNEIKAQIQKIDVYSNGRLKIDHIDFHHHLFDNVTIKRVCLDIAKEYNFPVRNEGEIDKEIATSDVLYSDFTIDNVNIESLRKMISEYGNTNKTVELMTHCGFVDDYTKTITSYIGRQKELDVLQQAKNEGLFDKVHLVSFDCLKRMKNHENY